ncbi:MAG TPA: endo-1,3-alpha-glucanase family glycosylhydrolase [Candidatus Sulfotelmatobacter sp.]|nr:endo-1,3-alpha-glucanase family glycosylhydrolase [Candidatus Sulfotelmatobacter sp.]
MRSTKFVSILLLCVAAVGCGANPGLPGKSFSTSTTSVNSLTINNTSAANSFLSQSNGNLGANNVSKMNVHSLLYPGATTKVFAHLMLWFGSSNHMNVGYKSNDPAQVQRQISDMISRGIDGVVIDWYGPNTVVDQATKLVMHEAEKHAGFTFAIMIDAGAMANACSGCPPQQALTQLLQYVEKTYFESPAYFTIQGQPVVTNFNVDRASVNWQAANGALKVPPRFLFQDQGGFTHAMSDGSFSWVMPQMPNYGFDYLASFYNTGLSFPNTETVGAAYKGFNDALAAWGSGRAMDQQCGRTWLQTFDQINSFYSSGRQLPYLQLVTWNDYEEGTEIETGIDSCFSLEASVSGNTLEWSINGDENTVDHYEVYRSQDGSSLTPLTQTETEVHSVDLCSLSIPAGNTSLYVQAVGKPMLANRMPAPVSYTASCGG